MNIRVASFNVSTNWDVYNMNQGSFALAKQTVENQYGTDRRQIEEVSNCVTKIFTSYITASYLATTRVCDKRSVLFLQEAYGNRGLHTILSEKDYVYFDPQAHLLQEQIQGVIQELENFNPPLQDTQQEVFKVLKERLKQKLMILNTAKIANLINKVSEESLIAYDINALLMKIKDLEGIKTLPKLIDKFHIELNSARTTTDDCMIAIPSELVLNHSDQTETFSSTSSSLKATPCSFYIMDQEGRNRSIPVVALDRVLFASYHNHGYDVDQPDPKDVKGIAAFMAQVVHRLDELAKKHQCKQIILGADMNTSPEAKGGKEIFEPLVNSGFKVLRTGQSETWNYRKNRMYETDFILVKDFTNSAIRAVTSLFYSKFYSPSKLTSYPTTEVEIDQVTYQGLVSEAMNIPIEKNPNPNEAETSQRQIYRFKPSDHSLIEGQVERMT